MKLKTRIIISSCIAVVVALLLSTLLLVGFLYEKSEEQALLEGYRETAEVVNDIYINIENYTRDEAKISYVNLCMKKRHSDYDIAYFVQGGREKEEIYNMTVFNFDRLNSLNYVTYSENSYYVISLARMKKNGRNYAVYNCMIDSNFYIYHIEDITGVKDTILEWTLVMAAVIVVIAIISMIFLWFVLKRALQPLNDLNKKAERIAQGDYDGRVDVLRNDEIGQLGNSFNKMAEAVQTRTNSLLESEHKKTLFMGDLTHELKTPMTAISGYAQTLLTVKLSDEDREEALNYIVEQCKRLERMSKKMTSLLELGQSDAFEIKEERVEKLFENAKKSCENTLNDKNMKLEIIHHNEKMLMDVDLMTNVLINLIDNAVKASSPGGRIMVEADKNIIKVKDFGKGIPEGEIEKILEPFYMVDKSRSRKSGGAGLGLALVAVILEKHHIKMTIQSKVGEGSTFILEFPG